MQVSRLEIISNAPKLIELMVDGIIVVLQPCGPSDVRLRSKVSEKRTQNATTSRAAESEVVPRFNCRIGRTYRSTNQQATIHDTCD